MKRLLLFSFTLLAALWFTSGCSSSRESTPSSDEVGGDVPAGEDLGREAFGDDRESEAIEEGKDLTPSDQLEEWSADSVEVADTHEGNEEPAVFHDWSPVFEKCSPSFEDCTPLGWYIVAPTYLRLNAHGDFEPDDCTGTVEVNGVEKAACSRLPCDVNLKLDYETKHAELRGSVTCWSEVKTVEASVSVFTVMTDEIAPCIRWGDWEVITLVGPENGAVFGSPRILKQFDLFHLLFPVFDSLPDTPSLAHLYQASADEWIHASVPETEMMASCSQVGATFDDKGSLAVLSLETWVLGEGYLRRFVTYRVLQDGKWSPRQALMPASGDWNATFTLTVDGDGRLDGLVFIVPPSEEFCGQSEWAWVCETLGNVHDSVLLRATKSNEGSWLIRKVYSEDNNVGMWMSAGAASRFLYHFDLAGIGSAAFLAGSYFIGFLSLLPDEVAVTQVCPPEDSTGWEWCTTWGAAAPTPKRDGLKAIVERGGVFRELTFTPGNGVVEKDVEWSADVTAHGYYWPRFVMSPLNTAGYEQMVVDALGRTHLAFTFGLEPPGPLLTLYIHEYPDGEGHEWQVEQIEEPGVSFLMMDSRATVYLFMFNADELVGPKGIKVLRRECLERLPVER